eukprot:9022005-Karenia_brevis.AAC.1
MLKLQSLKEQSEHTAFLHRSASLRERIQPHQGQTRGLEAEKLREWRNCHMPALGMSCSAWNMGCAGHGV